MAFATNPSSLADFFSDSNQQYQEHKASFTTFLEEVGDYTSKIKDLLDNDQTRLVIDLDDLRNHDPEMALKFLKNPLAFFAPWQDALHWYAKHQASIDTDVDLCIGVEGNFGSNRITPRELSAKFIGQLVCVEGIATTCSIVRPKACKKVQLAPATRIHMEQVYHDKTSLVGFPTSTVQPKKDAEGNILEEEFGLSIYTDNQTLQIQEMPENSPAGLLPCSVNVILTGDLVDKCKPGDRVRIIGMYRALGAKEQDHSSGFFKTVLIGNNVIQIGNQGMARQIVSDNDVANIRKISKRPDVFDLLSRSIAPSIYGHEYIKKALALLLMGGVEKNLENGTHLRGDINLLMVGDPSTAKSQLLRFVLNVAHFAINTTGRGSSGAGLTAAVVHDKDSDDRRLEAGAMVLADRGIVCIDEFDKMNDVDRVAIHEVMEQQTVTIAKAGIHMSLNARCSVVAAANPIYGQYDTEISPHKNVALPDSLVSRFDLLFIVLDIPTPKLDRKISEKVIANHCYVGKAGDIDPFDDLTLAKGKDETVYQKFDKFLHGHMKDKRGGHGSGQVDILSIPFLKKYIHFAKEMYEPRLTEQASKQIGEAYAKIRNRENIRGESMPITVRALETIIRLSTAHAKAHLRKTVSSRDVDAAVGILSFALENDAGYKGHRNESTEGAGDDDDDDDDNNEDTGKQDDPDSLDGKDDSQGSSASQESRRSPRTKRTRGKSVDDSSLSPEKKSKQQPGQSRPGRTKFFQSAMVNFMNEHSLYSSPLDELIVAVNGKLSGKDTTFTKGEVVSILEGLESKNLVMFRNNIVHRI